MRQIQFNHDLGQRPDETGDVVGGVNRTDIGDRRHGAVVVAVRRDGRFAGVLHEVHREGAEAGIHAQPEVDVRAANEVRQRGDLERSGVGALAAGGNVRIGRVGLADDHAFGGGGKHRVDAGHRGAGLVGDDQVQSIALVGVKAVIAIPRGDGGTRQRTGNGGERQHHVIAGTSNAEVGDREFIVASGDGRAFRESVESSRDHIRQIVVEDDEFVADRNGCGEGGGDVQHRAGEGVGAAHIELIVTGAGSRASQLNEVVRGRRGEGHIAAGENAGAGAGCQVAEDKEVSKGAAAAESGRAVDHHGRLLL